MRFLYSLLAVSVVLTGYFIYKPEQFTLAQKVGAQTYQDFLFRKTVTIDGLHVLRSDVLQEALPMDRSIAWWNLNRSSIETILERNPYIQSAKLQNCASIISDWACFRITVEERLPAYLSLHDDSADLLGDDGATIRTARMSQLEGALRRLLRPNALPPKVLVGLVTPGVSTDVTAARFRYLHNSVQIMEASGALRVERLELLGNGELMARFTGKPFEVNFDDTSRDLDRLKDEVKRLEKLTQELRGREDTVEKVDLAFNKMAVVSFRPAQK